MLLWMYSHLLIGCASLWCAWKLIDDLIHRRSLLVPGVVLIALALLARGLGDPRGGTFESGPAIGRFVADAGSGDWGFAHRHSFYPLRQQSVPSLPTLLFGESLLSLHLGAAIYLIMGLPILAYGLSTSLRGVKGGDAIGAISLASLMHWNFFNRNLFDFEQVLYPSALGSTAVGLYLLASREERPRAVYLLSISVWHLSFAYAPSLALAALAVLVMAIEAIRREGESRRHWALLVLCSGIGLGLGIFRFPPSLGGGIPTDATHLEQLSLVAKYIVLQEGTAPFMSHLLHLVFLAYLGSSLVFLNRPADALAALWMLTVFYACLTATGSYTNQSGALIWSGAQRVTVVAPVLAACLARALPRLSKRASVLAGLNLLALIVIVWGALLNWRALERRPILLSVRIMQHLLANKELVAQTSAILLDGGFHRGLWRVVNDSSYYFHGLPVRWLPEHCRPMPQPISGALVIIDSSSECLSLASGPGVCEIPFHDRRAPNLRIFYPCVQPGLLGMESQS